jgi:threonine/homoserine/homoserine lactone efflux protein
MSSDVATVLSTSAKHGATRAITGGINAGTVPAMHVLVTAAGRGPFRTRTDI